MFSTNITEKEANLSLSYGIRSIALYCLSLAGGPLNQKGQNNNVFVG